MRAVLAIETAYCVLGTLTVGEGPLIKEIMLAATKLGARLFRNNCGALEDKNGRWVHYGVCNPGGADLIGWTADGRFLAIEVKAGRTVTTAEQLKFIEGVNAAGGVGLIARDVATAVAALERKKPAATR